MSSSEIFDIAVVGSGPAGQKAAICGAKAGKRVVLIEQEREIGGACVRRGTIPSKTLRETALAYSTFKRKTGGTFSLAAPEHLLVQGMMSRLEQVISAHEGFMAEQLRRNDVVVWHGRASFSSPHELVVTALRGKRRALRADTIVLAPGSRPRTPDNVPVDHEHILDSDSILSMRYLPRSLVVLGAGVIACEYASIFAALGVAVTLIDKAARPLAFLEPELTDHFVDALERQDGKFLGGRTTRQVVFDGATVQIELDDGSRLEAEKVLCALGRVANVEGLELPNAGVTLSNRGLILVDEDCRTACPSIYAVGDVIGPPSLAASAMEQGRRAILHSLGIPAGPMAELIPTGVYCIPEMASVGLTESRARELGDVTIGRASFAEIARGQIAAIDGLLKLVTDTTNGRILGVHIVGEGASELCAVGQVAIQSNWHVVQLIETIFNFPTLAEAYRVAALDVVKRRAR